MVCKFDALSYIVVGSKAPTQWLEFAENIVGAEANQTSSGALFIKLDKRDYRIVVEPHHNDCFLACGWQVNDAEALEDVQNVVKRAGIAVEVGCVERLRQRQVQGLICFRDPSGNQHEVCHGYAGDGLPFHSPLDMNGFVTGSMGMGHVALPAAQNFGKTLHFLTDVLGFGLSDVFDFKPSPDSAPVRIRFLHAANGRHHSIALAEMPHPAGCIHAMVEVTSMTDVGKAYDRMQEAGLKLMATLGQHVNDKMTSFYMLTPGNFALEYGYGGITIEPGITPSTHSEAASIWGHDFSIGFA